MANIRSFRWEQALQLALKHQQHIDTVLLERRKLLTKMHKSETLAVFLRASKEVSIDEEVVKQKVQNEVDKERTRQ